MDLCTQCGAELGIGRFCTNCGRPVSEPATAASWRTDTAERARVPAPPPVPSAPEVPGFPLYADQHDAPVADTETAPPRHRGADPSPGAGWLPWSLGLLVMVLIAVAGGWLLLGGDDPEPGLAQQESSRSGDRTPGRDRSPEPKPKPTPTKEPAKDSGEPVDLTPSVRVEAPAPAPPSQDSSGNTVRYLASNMLDGREETTWRMPGDGTGESITFRLDSPAVLTEVGLINGYAKVGQDSSGLLDWYAGNRRILEVEWTFDDGTVATQTLRETAEMQTLSLDGVKTASVTLRLLDVSDPGAGRASRDYTAISDVSLIGSKS